MKNLIFSLIFIVTAGVVLSGFVLEGQNDSEGKIYLEVSWQGSKLVAHSYLINEYAPFVPRPDGSDHYQLLDQHAKPLTSGKTDIPRFIANCRIDNEDHFEGTARSIDDTFYLSLPYHPDTDKIVLHDPHGHSFFTVKLKSLRKDSIPKISPSTITSSHTPQFGEFINSLKQDRYFSDAGQQSTPSQQSGVANLSGHVVVKGLDSDQHIEADIGFYLNDKDYYDWNTEVTYAHFDNAKSEEFSVSLKPGRYIARVWAVHHLEGFDNVSAPLYPYPKIVTGIEITDENKTTPLEITFDANNLLIGTVKRKGGKRMPAEIAVFDDKRNGSLLQRGLMNIFPANDDGIFAVHLPARKWVFAVIPKNHDETGELLTIVDVKDGKTTRKKFRLPPFKSKSGKALKRIWPEESTVASTSKNGKLKILLLADAYTALNESFDDANSNGKWDGDLHLDENGNGKIDNRPNGRREYFFDRNRNGRYDAPEPFTDTNGDGICNQFERSKFELDSAFAARALLNIEPFRSFANRIEIYTYWEASTHGVQRIKKALPWQEMQTAFGSFCNGSGGFQSGSVKNAPLWKKSIAILPDVTIPVLMVHDPFYILGANTFYDFGRIIMSAEDHRMGSIFIHEMGHSLGNLGDEYVYSPGSHYRGKEPIEVNLTKKTNISKVKWQQFIRGFPPVPTPYDWDGYGLFEGGAYGETGIYRPAAQTIMRNDYYTFGKVNEKQLKKRLRMFK